MQRNRSEGWRFAKIDGHANEAKFAEELLAKPEMIDEIEGLLDNSMPEGDATVVADGSKKVPSIFGDLTMSKTDIEIKWDGGEQVNISVKKSTGGQVWLIQLPRFIASVEHEIGALSAEVVKGLSLFIGGDNLAGYQAEFDAAVALDAQKLPSIVAQEKRHRRLVADSMVLSFPSEWKKVLEFFNTNIGLITRLSFAQGLAAEEAEFADVVIYNQITDQRNIFPIAELVAAAEKDVLTRPVVAGTRYNGSTLVLPFGSLQMHRPKGVNQFQFRHEFREVSRLFS
jgi:hypothetical protein